MRSAFGLIIMAANKRCWLCDVLLTEPYINVCHNCMKSRVAIREQPELTMFDDAEEIGIIEAKD